MDICLAAARAAASRRNGAKSRGPRTPEGKARSAQNALKHGFRAQQHVVLPGEDAAAFRELEAALLEELAPVGALQAVLARRIVAAAWRLERAERLEAELFGREMHGLFGDGDLGLALIRDGNGARSFDTLLRYRGGTLAELWRALRTLKALQAEQAARLEPAVGRERRLPPEPHETPIEPEGRGDRRETVSVAAGGKVVASVVASALPEEPPVRCEKPIEPEARGNPGDVAPAPAADVGRGRPHEDLRAHAATQKCVTMQHSCAAPASSPANSA
jgi:hypothetical protein